MIIDACLFAGEGSMLELRLRTLAGVVDRFVVVACERTHQGEQADVSAIHNAYASAVLSCVRSGLAPNCVTLHWVKPSRVLERHGRIFDRPEGERGPAGSRWFQHIERQHRDGVVAAVREVCDDEFAVVMVSDVDEIPNPDVVVGLNAWLYADSDVWRVLAQRFHSGALDVLHPQQPWWGTCASLFGRLEPQAHRDARATIGTDHQSVRVVEHGGVHLSWFGTDQERQRKLETFSHAELVGKFDPAEGRRLMLHANGEQLRRVTVEESYEMWWPASLLDGSFSIPTGWISDDAWEPDNLAFGHDPPNLRKELEHRCDPDKPDNPEGT